MASSTGSGNQNQRRQSKNSTQNLSSGRIDYVEVQREFPESLGGDVARVQWITVHYVNEDIEDDEEYYNEIAEDEFFPEDTEDTTGIAKYQTLIDQIADHYHITQEKVLLVS